VNYVLPSARGKGRNLAIVGKPVQKKGEEQDVGQAQQASGQEAEGAISSPVKSSKEEAKIVAVDQVHLKKVDFPPPPPPLFFQYN
jgi:hypothetical protein